jgi:hypothetical protein
MNIRSSDVVQSAEALPAGLDRPPLKRVRCLLPIWGYPYIKKFLEVALPTWLAEGNLPALSAALPTEFVLLTSREDETYLRAHPGFKRLSAACKTTVHYIDHLITGNNYSTTITLAYAEAVRSLREEMLDTCFFFLVSDYIVADGSFGNVLKRMQAGRSGILVGNFQVVEEEALPWLVNTLQTSPQVLRLTSRNLMKWALSHLHPATVANTVNYPMNHNDHTNRLFWRVDNHTLIGRFYLMHMIAIRPELTDFVIGSSCDYSFVPEMCPSNNVEIITDSDDYLVIEMQPRNHEAKSLKSGTQKVEKLAITLSEWTTARHRENSQTTVVFHAAEIPGDLETHIAVADRFIAKVKAKLKRKPKSHRRHPYWKGAMAAFSEATGATLTGEEWRLALGLPNPELDDAWLGRWLREKLQFAMFGKPPNVRPWHPRYPDHALVLNRLRGLQLEDNTYLLMVSDVPTIFTATFTDGGERVVRFRSSHMVKQPYEIFEPLQRHFDLCLVELEERELSTSDELLDRIAPMMRDGATVLVAVTNRRNGDPTLEFQRSLGFHASRMIRPYTRSVTFSFVTASGLRWRAFSAMQSIGRLARNNPPIGMPLLVLFGLPLSAMCGWGNFISKVKVGMPPKTYTSSALVSLVVDAESAAEAYQYSNSRVLRDRKQARLGLPTDHKLPLREDLGKAPSTEDMITGRRLAIQALTNPALVTEEQSNGPMMTKELLPAEGTREPQYNRCIEIRDKQGLTSLGLMTNQVFEDDPRRLTFLLARYKFVSKMLEGKKFVGELGCGDAFGTRVVMQAVDKVIAYDFDPVFIEDIRTRRSPTWPVEAHFHNILESPLPNTHDGIYSLDVIEHIERTEEHVYIEHLKQSLSDDGVLILGSPSLESQTYASPPSKEGHVNCKSGKELKALLEQYFHNVFLFSMNDEVVHTGFSPMAHYLFVICCNKK